MFLPSAPWHIRIFGPTGGYIETPSADPGYIYQDVLVAIDRARDINNGQPSLHARFMCVAEPQPGETVVHIGAGTGYYSAILSLLVSPAGRIEAFEIDAELAKRAAKNLTRFNSVRATAGDATTLPIPEADVIYVNAGVAAPPLRWCLSLQPGGRMIVPWRPTDDIGLALLITRLSSGYKAVPIMPAWFIPCVGKDVPSSDEKPPDKSSAGKTRSLWFVADRKPDATATATYRDVWFSTDAITE
jgi:protein-L-isoaspartate(D-aspartate) O-methyltransferase